MKVNNLILYLCRAIKQTQQKNVDNLYLKMNISDRVEVKKNPKKYGLIDVCLFYLYLQYDFQPLLSKTDH